MCMLLIGFQGLAFESRHMTVESSYPTQVLPSNTPFLALGPRASCDLVQVVLAS